jgi:zinc-ribbon domain
MFCSKCGVDLPDDSQFCRKCGQAQSVTSASRGAAAAVAPARIPVAARLPKWVLPFVLLVVVCGVVWHFSLNAFGGHATASQPLQQPPVQLHKVSLPLGAFTVGALASNNYTFTAPAGAFDVTLKGHFAATGGSGNDIEVFVLSEDEFVNWQNGHPAKTFFNSEKITQDSINLTLPSEAASYHVVFNNKFSLLTPKAVQANIDLTFYTR